MIFTWLPVSVWLALITSAQPEPQPCTAWRGTVQGNDPSVVIRATLCPTADHQLHGTLTWRGERSGSSQRTLEGSWQDRAVQLHDTAVTGKPSAGWMFCKIDRYTLTATDDDHLSGRYHSEACRDDATIELTRVR